MGSKPNWTAAEKAYLQENYGDQSIRSLSRRLKRSPQAIRLMAHRLGLGALLDNGDYVSLNQVHQAIYGTPGCGYTLKIWIKHGLPYRLQRVEKCQFRVIGLDDFWSWAEQHKGLMNFRKFEPNALGLEPAWVDIKRRHDVAGRPHNQAWSAQEDAMLRRLVAKHTYAQLSELLNRTHGAIKKRLSDLKIQERPIRTVSRKWTDWERATLLQLYESGLSHDAIGRQLGRTGGSVRAMHERLVNPDYQANYRARTRKGSREQHSWQPAGRHGYRIPVESKNE